MLYKKISGLLSICAIAAIVAGCGSSSSDSGTSATAQGKKGEPVTAASKKVGLEATGGTAGAADPKKTPVVIGFITDDGIEGLPGPPFYNSLDAAVAFINKDLGGIQGHPLKTVKCGIKQSTDEGTTCAQKMINNPAINSIVTGANSLGDTEILNTVKGQKPIFTAISSGQADATAENVFGFLGGIPAGFSMLTYIVDNLKAKSVALMGASDPVSSLIVGLQKATFQNQLGIKDVKAALFGSGTTDLTATIAASGAQTADARLLAAASNPTCLAVAKGLKTIDVSKPTVTLGTCADPAIAKAVGDLPQWTYYYPYVSTAAPQLDPSGQSATYINAVAAYADPELAEQNYSPTVFATVMTLAKVLNDVGFDAKPDEISKATRAYTGGAFLGPDKLEFGKQPYPGLGSAGGRMYGYEGNGKWVDKTNGQWVEPPPPVVNK